MMDFKKDNELINEFHKRSGHSRGSVISYQTVFNMYREFHNMALSDLLDEAIREQEQQVPNNRLRIYDRILTFQDFLVENYSGNTPSAAISKIKTFYRYNRVVVPFIPPLNPKTLKRNEVISFADLPKKDEIRHALEYADDELKLWILVMVSSGSTRADAKSITH